MYYEKDSFTPPRPAPRPRPSLPVVAVVSACIAAIAVVAFGSSLLFDGAFGATHGADKYPHISPPSSVPGPPVPQATTTGRRCG